MRVVTEQSDRKHAIGCQGQVEIESESTRAKTRGNSGKALSARQTAPLKPKAGLSGHPPDFSRDVFSQRDTPREILRSA